MVPPVASTHTNRSARLVWASDDAAQVSTLPQVESARTVLRNPLLMTSLELVDLQNGP